jgi:hypothetical protein
LTANESSTSTRVRFYSSLETSLIAWVAAMFAIGGTFEFDRLALYVVILLGTLAILGAAIRHPIYRTLRDSR